MVENNGLVSAAAHAEDANRGLDELFNPLYVLPGGLGQLLEPFALGNILAPALHFLVNRFRLRQNLHVRGEISGNLAVNLVGGADLYRVESGENVQKSEGHAGGAVGSGGEAGDNRVQPAAASGSAGGGAELVALFANPVAGFVEKLMGKGPSPTLVE